ncbi:MAG: ferrous iron transport protein A [Ruminococcaceae bacterium]|nr:ferrous iron transport protein A [Oscillospiraceae bacterium]
MIPLCCADPEKEYVITKIGGKPEVKKHLENLGFIVGDSVAVITEQNGNIIVKVKDSRIAISREMAVKIYV